MRVVSLLPAATEIVHSLGLGDQLVAVSHDCDHPSYVLRKPQITRCEIHDAGLSSREVDDWVRRTLAERESLYTIDETLLRQLEPDVILTQRLCDVCAPSYGSVASLAATLAVPPQLVNLEPSSLAGIFANIREVARVLGVPERGEEVVVALEGRVEAVRRRAALADRRPTCLLVEWLEPLYCSGHWGPELVTLAGASEPLGRQGRDSLRIAWESVIEARPEVLVLAGCGNSVARTMAELPVLQRREGWGELPAVREGRVYVVDGSAYFSRPGPRIVDSLEILAGLVHPELFPEWRAEGQPRERVLRVARVDAA